MFRRPRWTNRASSQAPPTAAWSEDEIVLLHWRLLQETRRLADPATPPEEKLDALRWVFTELEKNGLPFRFVNCLRAVGYSPLSPILYRRLVDAEKILDRIRQGLGPGCKQRWSAVQHACVSPWRPTPNGSRPA
jgi:hypothetical protein